MLKVKAGRGFRAEEDKLNSSTFMAEKNHSASCRTPPEGNPSFPLTHFEKKAVFTF